MKRIINFALTFCLVAGLLFPLNARAASEEIELYGDSPSVSITKKVTDSDGNRYDVTGRTTRTGKQATVSTFFNVRYYYGGTEEDKAEVNGYKKNLTARAQVSLSGGGANTLGGTSAKTGASNGYSANKTYLYSVTGLVGTHKFSCNGGSTSFTTSN